MRLIFPNAPLTRLNWTLSELLLAGECALLRDDLATFVPASRPYLPHPSDLVWQPDTGPFDLAWFLRELQSRGTFCGASDIFWWQIKYRLETIVSALVNNRANADFCASMMLEIRKCRVLVRWGLREWPGGDTHRYDAQFDLGPSTIRGLCPTDHPYRQWHQN